MTTESYTAEELALAVKGRLIKLTGLSPEYMRVLTRIEKNGMSMFTHGFSGGEGDASLLADEAYFAFDQAIEALIAGGVPLSGRFDQIHGCELVFYE